MEGSFDRERASGNQVNTLKSEHLREGVRPIVACIYRRDEDLAPEDLEEIEHIKETGQDVDYYGTKKYWSKEGMMNSGRQTYAISAVNERDKYSEMYFNCTGVVAVGIDKETRQEISILSHQDPEQFLEKYKEQYEEHLTDVLRTFLTRAEPGTVDIAIFGGNTRTVRASEYVDSIKTVSDICAKSVGFEPVVLTGPNMVGGGSTNIYFNTQKRRLHLVRPEQVKSSLNESHAPKDIDRNIQRWRRTTSA